jgi:hypothetical protein
MLTKIPNKHKKILAKMPILVNLAIHINEKLSTEKKYKLLKNTAILFCQHIDEPTLGLLLALQYYFGVNPQNCFGKGKHYSTIKKYEKLICKGKFKLEKIDFTKYKNCIDTETVSNNLNIKFLEKYLCEIAKKFDDKQINCVIVLDDGGRIASHIMKAKGGDKKNYSTKVYNACKIISEQAFVINEQTSNGLDHIITKVYNLQRKNIDYFNLKKELKEILKKCYNKNGSIKPGKKKLASSWKTIIEDKRTIYTPPVICTASSAIKNLLEPKFISEVAIEKLMLLFPELQNNKEKQTIGIIGMGNIGKALAKYLKELGHIILIADCNENKKINKKPNYIPCDKITLIKKSTYIMDCTGRDSSKDYAQEFANIFNTIKENKYFINFGSSIEAFKTIFKTLKNKLKRIKNQDKVILLPEPLLPLVYNGKAGFATFVFGGHPINFRHVWDSKKNKIRKYSVPIQKFQIISALLLWGVIQGYYSCINDKSSRTRRLYEYLERTHPIAQKYLIYRLIKDAPQIIEDHPNLLDLVNIFNRTNEINLRSSYGFTKQSSKNGAHIELPTGLDTSNYIYQLKYKDILNKLFLNIENFNLVKLVEDKRLNKPPKDIPTSRHIINQKVIKKNMNDQEEQQNKILNNKGKEITISNN